MSEKMGYAIKLNKINSTVLFNGNPIYRFNTCVNPDGGEFHDIRAEPFFLAGLASNLCGGCDGPQHRMCEEDHQLWPVCFVSTLAPVPYE